MGDMLKIERVCALLNDDMADIAKDEFRELCEHEQKLEEIIEGLESELASANLQHNQTLQTLQSKIQEHEAQIEKLKKVNTNLLGTSNRLRNTKGILHGMYVQAMEDLSNCTDKNVDLRKQVSILQTKLERLEKSLAMTNQQRIDSVKHPHNCLRCGSSYSEPICWLIQAKCGCYGFGKFCESCNREGVEMNSKTYDCFDCSGKKSRPAQPATLPHPNIAEVNPNTTKPPIYHCLMCGSQYNTYGGVPDMIQAKCGCRGYGKYCAYGYCSDPCGQTPEYHDCLKCRKCRK